MKKYYEVRDKSLRALISGNRIRYVKANEELNFTASEGETVAIVGESGCGKSTFAKVLMGLEKGTDGEVLHREGAEEADLDHPDLLALRVQVLDRLATKR